MDRVTLKDKTSRPLFAIRKKDGLQIKIAGAHIDMANKPVNIPRAIITLDDEAVNFVFVDYDTLAIVSDSSIGDFPIKSKPLYEITTASGEIVSVKDVRAVVRMAAHSSCETHDQWLKEVTVNADVPWTDFDISNVIDIPPTVCGIRMKVHVKESGAVPAGESVYVLLRTPGDTAQSQWESVPAQISGRWAIRTVPVKLGGDGKTIQYKIDVDTEIQLKIGLAGWIYG